MSDMQKRSTRRARKPRKAPDEMELELFAIEEAFIAEYRAGLQPRLSTYLRRSPTHSEALTEFAATFLSAPDETIGEEDMIRQETPRTLPTKLSAGTLHALDQIFAAQESDRPQARSIAERRLRYGNTREQDENGEPES